MTEPSESRGLRTFLVVWSGQLVSLLGSGLTSFALGVWVYQRTGSATQFVAILLATHFPIVALSLISGPLVDRWDRRWTLMMCDCAAALPIAVIALLLRVERLQVWHIYLAVGLASASIAFQWPAYGAATTMLVPRRHLARAAGMVEFARAAAQIFAPILGGLLMSRVQIWVILLLDIGSFLFAISTLALVRVPRPPARSGAARGSLWSEVRFGWSYLVERRGLLWLLAYFSFMNFSLVTILGLTTPMILSFSNVAALSLVLSTAAIGLLVGGALMSTWGGPRSKTSGLLWCGVLFGAGACLAGVRASVPLIAAGLFLHNLSVPFMNGCSQAIWQSKVPPDLQGRIFAIRRMFSTLSVPLGYGLAGPLADHVFNPLMASGGALAASLGRFVGVGPGRGIGLIFVLQGLFAILVAQAGFLSPRLVGVESELPDAILEEPAVQV
jgi:DHA3 family macrolide efflux protein-like MFS transporter